MHSMAVRSWVAGALSLGILIAAVLGKHAFVDRPDPIVRAILETAVVIVGTLVAFLAFGRFRRSGSMGDLAVVCAVALLAWVHTLFGSVPDLISPDSVGNGISERFEVWGTLVVRLMVSGLLIAAVRLGGPSRRRAPLRGVGRSRSFIAVGTLGALAVAVLVWRVPIARGGLLMQSSWPGSISSVGQLIGACLFLTAFVCLSSRARQRSDEFLSWIGIGCIFATFAMVSYGLLPPGGAGSLRPGDLLRAATVCVWAVGAIAEIRSYWSTVAASARLEARRNVALDLHDGLAQELALLAAFSYYRADERASPEWQEQLRQTAERALADARRAIAVLAGVDPLPLDTDGGSRAHGSDDEVDVCVEGNGEVLPSDHMQRESIVRIVREAVTNAVRHGGAHHIAVDLDAGETSTLRVSDDGTGFDVAGASETGRLGLASMRKQAEVIGGLLHVESAPGRGTTVEVLWP